MDDLVEIVDVNDIMTGESKTRIEAHKLALPHRIASVFVFSDDGRLVVQVRKDNGRYDHSVGGHVDIGESYEQAAQREMEEELGIVAPLSPVRMSVIEDCRETGYGPIVHVHGLFQTIAPQDWVFKPNDEVADLKLVSIDEIDEGMSKNPDNYTYGFVKTLAAYKDSTK